MEAGSLRAQIAHETESKEDELAELRESLHKKITSLEQQLEEEYNNGKTALKVGTMTWDLISDQAVCLMFGSYTFWLTLNKCTYLCSKSVSWSVRWLT